MGFLDLNFKSQDKENAVVFELSGELTGGPYLQEMNESLHKLIDEGKKNIVMDMSGVSLITSIGIGIMISFYHTMNNAGGSLKFCHFSDKVHHVIYNTKLYSVLDYFESVDEALKSYE